MGNAFSLGLDEGLGGRYRGRNEFFAGVRHAPVTEASRGFIRPGRCCTGSRVFTHGTTSLALSERLISHSVILTGCPTLAVFAAIEQTQARGEPPTPAPRCYSVLFFGPRIASAVSGFSGHECLGYRIRNSFLTTGYPFLQKLARSSVTCCGRKFGARR